MGRAIDHPRATVLADVKAKRYDDRGHRRVVFGRREVPAAADPAAHSACTAYQALGRVGDGSPTMPDTPEPE